MSIQFLDLKEIQPDFFFRFSTDRDLAPLAHSIQQGGLLTPLPVLAGPEGYRLVGGFSRLLVLSDLGQTPVPCRVLDLDISIAVHFLNELEAHALARPLDLMEKVRALAILDRLKAEPLHLHRFLTLVDWPDQKALLDFCRLLAQVPEVVQTLLSRTDVSLRQAEVLDGLSPASQAAFAQWALDLGVRPVEWSQVVSLAREIARREDIAPELLLDLFPSGDNRAQQLAQGKAAMQRRRYPTLSAWLDQMEQDRKKLRLPSGVTLDWDRTLERPGLELKARLDDADSLQKLYDWLSDAVVQNRLSGMVTR